eukprot:126964-Rhodomonas_salina.1
MLRGVWWCPMCASSLTLFLRPLPPSSLTLFLRPFCGPRACPDGVDASPWPPASCHSVPSPRPRTGSGDDRSENPRASAALEPLHQPHAVSAPSQPSRGRAATAAMPSLTHHMHPGARFAHTHAGSQ